MANAFPGDEVASARRACHDPGGVLFSPSLPIPFILLLLLCASARVGRIVLSYSVRCGGALQGSVAATHFLAASALHR
jgi:hypothetical protein